MPRFTASSRHRCACFILGLLVAASFAGARPQDDITFAVIGDYGDSSGNEAAVAKLVASFKPDFIVTVGDNSYLAPNAESYDRAVGRFYSNYIGHYKGRHGGGAASNRFWPAIGNHDWNQATGFQPYLDYFTLSVAPDSSANERYYDFVQGPVHFFILNSDSHEPDGRSRTSAQAQWLQKSLATSTSTWKFVVLHHAPFSSGAEHGPNAHLQWPFKRWGAHTVLAGHDHIYERLNVGGAPYFVNGIGGRSLYALARDIMPQSTVRFNAQFGAMLVTVNDQTARFEAFSIENGSTLIDSFPLAAGSAVPDLIPPAAVWKYLDDGSDQGADWRGVDFDDSLWKSGMAQLGYGDQRETTTINFGPDRRRRFITAYFRHAFDVADPAAIRRLTLSVLRDDGAVIYLNGKEVWRPNMPAGTITHLTRALAAVADAAERTFYETAVDPSLLVSGRNVMAVEIHQSGPASSDMSFDLMLTPEFAQPSAPIAPQPPNEEKGTIDRERP